MRLRGNHWIRHTLSLLSGLALSALPVLGQPTFTDVTVSANVGNSLAAAPRVGTNATWGDYDGDGDLDLYVTNWASSVSNSINRLYRNNGNGTFSDVASAASSAAVAKAAVAAGVRSRVK